MRSKEHYRDNNNENKKSWMRKHISKYHKENPNDCEFAWSVINNFEKPMLRQLTEAVIINSANDNEIMNLKTEYCSNNIQGIELRKLTCRSCGRKVEGREELREHIRAVHERNKCRDCEYVSFGSRDLEDHRELMHKQQKQQIFIQK